MASDREPGFYWVTFKMSDGTLAPPKVEEWASESWYMCGSEEWSSDEGVIVLGQRLEPPDGL